MIIECSILPHVKGLKIKAKQNDGILTVSIPKKPEAVEKGPKQISIT